MPQRIAFCAIVYYPHFPICFGPTTTQETMASQDSANDHKNIVYGAARLCMVEYYHEENEALHKALATTTQHVEQLKTSNTGLKHQRDYNAAMLNNANIRIDNMERFQDITQRAMMYQSEVIQCLTKAFKNVTTGEPQHSIFTAQVQFELDTIHNTFSAGHPWMERTIVDEDIEMENDEPLVPLQDEEETETDMEDGEETDSDMEIEI